MHFSFFNQFISMGGYAIYVWPAYGITALVLLINLILPLRRKRKVLQALASKKII